MNLFIKVTLLSRDFFSNIEYEEDITICLNQISAIYDNTVVIGESKYMKLTPESMKKLKEYIEIECKDCTGKGDNNGNKSR